MFQVVMVYEHVIRQRLNRLRNLKSTLDLYDYYVVGIFGRPKELGDVVTQLRHIRHKCTLYNTIVQ